MKPHFHNGCLRWFRLGMLLCLVGAAHATVIKPDRISQLPPAANRAVDFDQDIAPIFATACLACHGPDKQKHSLRLDVKEAALNGGDSGPAIVPGKSAESLLIHLVSGLVDDLVMPQKGDRLTAEQIGLLRAWIDRGANWPENNAAAKPDPRLKYWAFQPVVRPALPAVANQRWASNPLDRFIVARLEKLNLQPSPATDRTTLIRRLTFDLHGLPPTPAEADAFLADKSPGAVANVVDRLLAAPRYGERWARHWLDVARFCESNGFERDQLREHSWRYRDYVIASLNADKPYTQFVREQIAGDVLEPVTRDGIIATSFLVAGPNDEAGKGSVSALLRARIREEELEDMIAVVSQTFMGVTVNCARCHDHKFDPIPQRDYYRLKAAITGVHPGDHSILTPAENQVRESQTSPINARISEMEKQIAAIEFVAREKLSSEQKITISASAPPAITTSEALKALTTEQRQQRDALFTELVRHREMLKTIPPAPLVYGAISRAPEPTFVLARGDVEKKKEPVSAGALSAVRTLSADFALPADAPEGQRRVKLAEWLASADNPLTARVIVNRVWHYHFGRGLVATPNDLGAVGERPSHPELLDWLASEFMAQGWSLKKLHRLILLSNTYQQASLANEKATARDADNRLLWRFPPRRLEAEAVRDTMLAVSGQLNNQLGGPGFRPFDMKIANSSFYTLTDPIGPDFNRRTVYRIGVQSAKDPLLDSFDCPDFSTKTPVRGITTTPLQALSLMNNSFVLRQAHHFAERLKTEAGANVTAQINRAYRLALGRKPTPGESQRATVLARAQGVESMCWVLLNASEFLYVR